MACSAARGGAKRCFAVLDIQTLIACGSVRLSFGYCMNQTQRNIAANRLGDRPFGCIDRCVGAVDTDNDPLWRLRIDSLLADRDAAM